jgi:TRAP-type C4-dicarboxylate transport system permease small subunit
MKKFARFTRKVGEIAADAAAIMLLAMFAINCIDIIGSKFFNLPFPGVVELTGYLMSILIPAAAALVFLEGEHILIDVVTEKLPEAVKNMMGRIISLALFFLFSVLVWKMFTYGMDRHRYGEYSDTLHFPFYYIIYCIALAFIPFCLALIQDFLSPSGKEKGSP